MGGVSEACTLVGARCAGVGLRSRFGLSRRVLSGGCWRRGRLVYEEGLQARILETPTTAARSGSSGRSRVQSQLPSVMTARRRPGSDGRCQHLCREDATARADRSGHGGATHQVREREAPTCLPADLAGRHTAAPGQNVAACRPSGLLQRVPLPRSSPNARPSWVRRRPGPCPPFRLPNPRRTWNRQRASPRRPRRFAAKGLARTKAMTTSHQRRAQDFVLSQGSSMRATGATAASTTSAKERKIIEHIRIKARIQTTMTAITVTTTAPRAPPVFPGANETRFHSRPAPSGARSKPKSLIKTR